MFRIKERYGRTVLTVHSHRPVSPGPDRKVHYVPVISEISERAPCHSTRERLDQGKIQPSDGATVMVAEINCQVPGCPPIETVIAFWSDPETRYRIKIFKPVADVTEDDLPVSWLLPALLDEDDLGCDCC